MSTECPRGIINEPYPGSCNLYQDANSNQLCDLSEINPTPVINQTVKPQLNFDLTLIVFLVIPIIIYALTSKQKLFWNIVLLITFILTAISTFGYIFGFYNQFLNNIHIHVGTIFLSISLCHTLWHLPYWKKTIKLGF